MTKRAHGPGNHHLTRALVRIVSRPLSDRSLAGFVLYRIRWSLLLVSVLFVASTFGYVRFEHFGVLSAAFFTVITLSTVGYGIQHHLNSGGLVFTMIVIIVSFAGLLYTASVLTNLFTSGDALAHLQQAKGRRMRTALENHVIVVGFGRVGQAVARGVVALGRSCLVIERLASIEGAILAAGCAALIGDATEEKDLVEAGIDRAVALVAATEEDATNLVVTLTARAVRPDLRIVSRVNEAGWQDRILRAGANTAQSPYPSYGLSLAATAVGSSSVEMLELPSLGLATEEIQVEDGSPLVGRTVDQVGDLQPDVFIMGVRRQETFRRWHELSSPILPGDVILALGTPEGVRGLAGQT